MNKRDFISNILQYFSNNTLNYVSEDKALAPELVKLQLCQEPIVGFASAGDAYFEQLKEDKVIGGFHMAPKDWLTDAETVISIFLPFSERVVESNSADMSYPSKEWLHARIEGQILLVDMCRHMADMLRQGGFSAKAPMLEPEFAMIEAAGSKPDFPDQNAEYTSTWSERHIAYGCGLGTFGLSKGLITEKGIAGRFGSVVTSASFEATERKYTGVYDYCVNCGACARNCPTHCISLENGKNHPPCAEFIEFTLSENAPRYGCGKCQVKVPCSTRNPSTAKPGRNGNEWTQGAAEIKL